MMRLQSPRPLRYFFDPKGFYVTGDHGVSVTKYFPEGFEGRVWYKVRVHEIPDLQGAASGSRVSVAQETQSRTADQIPHCRRVPLVASRRQDRPQSGAGRAGMIHVPPAIQQHLDAGALCYVSHSGGKDSQAMYAALAEIVPPERIVVVHSDLGEIEWEGVQDHNPGDHRPPAARRPRRQDLLRHGASPGRYPARRAKLAFVEYAPMHERPQARADPEVYPP